MTNDERNAVLDEAANAARTATVMHGDHNAAYFAPSTDGDTIARVIEGLKR